MATSKRLALNSSTPTVVDSTPGQGLCILRNADGTISMFLGGPNVSSTTGYTLIAGAVLTLSDGTQPGLLYAIAASGTPTIEVLRP